MSFEVPVRVLCGRETQTGSEVKSEEGSPLSFFYHSRLSFCVSLVGVRYLRCVFSGKLFPGLGRCGDRGESPTPVLDGDVSGSPDGSHRSEVRGVVNTQVYLLKNEGL